jgi:hypothetical protein
MTQTETPNNTTTVDPERRSLTRKQFCEAEGISLSTYAKLKRQGHAPDETNIPGMTLVRISPKARRKWHVDNEKWSKSKEGKLEVQRRVANATNAGRKAAKSPKHVSKRKKGKSKSAKA